MKLKKSYEIRMVDAWREEDCWTWNESFHICDFDSAAENLNRAFLRKLKDHGYSFRRGTIRINFDCDILEVVTRKDSEPLFAMIPNS